MVIQLSPEFKSESLATVKWSLFVIGPSFVWLFVVNVINDILNSLLKLGDTTVINKTGKNCLLASKHFFFLVDKLALN